MAAFQLGLAINAVAVEELNFRLRFRLRTPNRNGVLRSAARVVAERTTNRLVGELLSINAIVESLEEPELARVVFGFVDEDLLLLPGFAGLAILKGQVDVGTFRWKGWCVLSGSEGGGGAHVFVY